LSILYVLFYNLYTEFIGGCVQKYTTEVGDYLVIWITGSVILYVAEVTQKDPLRMKVEESGPYAHLKEGDYIIREEDTIKIQQDNREDTCVFLSEKYENNVKVGSGLKSLGLDKLRYILPPTKVAQFLEEEP
jgi:hypothetical protein